MKNRVAEGVLMATVLGSSLCVMGQTSATPNPSTLPVPTQTNPAGTSGTNSGTPPDPTPPASAHPAPPPQQKAPDENAPNPQTSEKSIPNAGTPAANPGTAQQTSPTGGSGAIQNSQPSKTPGSTTPGAAEAGGVASLNAGGMTSDQLHQRIDSALRNEPTLSGSNLTVNVSDDAIDLSGTVSSPKERLTARRIVQSFAGNRKVRERVTVGGTRGSNPSQDSTNAPSSSKQDSGAKGEEQNLNRPISDPAKQGDRSGDPR
jgi:hypothetical protein